jgi:hypothetical protein
MRVRTKIVVLGIGGVCAAAVSLVAIGTWQTERFSGRADHSARALVEADLDHSTKAVYNLVQAQSESVSKDVDSALAVAQDVLPEHGAVELGTQKVSWTAVNQLPRRRWSSGSRS